MAKLLLKEVLEEKGKSLYWLAEETNISYPTLHKLAQGNTISANFDTLEIICNVLNIDLTDLIKLDKNNRKKSKKLFKNK